MHISVNFLHLVHLAIGFHKVSSNRSSQIDWTEVVVIAFFSGPGLVSKFWRLWKLCDHLHHKIHMVGWYFFVFKYIYICGCIYQLPLPIYKMVFQIFYKMEVPDTGIWSCSHIKWCWVCINRSLSTKWSAPTAKKKHKIWFIGGPGPTILNVMGLPKCRVPSLPPYKMVWGHLQNGSTHGGCCLQNRGPRVPHLPTNIKYFGLT